MTERLDLAEIKLLTSSALVDYIDQLIDTDFDYLTYILYRVDVNEHLLRKKLAATDGAQAAQLIAQMLTERWSQQPSSTAVTATPPSDIWDELW